MFPNHPYVGYSLHDVDWIAENLAEGWHISALWSNIDGKAVVELVKIYNDEECWHFSTTRKSSGLFSRMTVCRSISSNRRLTWRWLLKSLLTSARGG